MFIRFIIIVLAGWVFSAHAAPPSPQWVTLDGCSIVPSPFNDGDSFRVRQGDKEYIFRLYFVDSPEEDAGFPERIREQGEYFGIPINQVTNVGREARETVQALLAQPFSIVTRWHSAQGRSRTPRYYAFVQSAGKDLAEELVARGYARVYGVRASTPAGEKAIDYRARLLALEDQARLAKRGAWELSRPLMDPPIDRNQTDLRVVVVPRTVTIYTEELPRRRLGELPRETRVQILEEFPDGWVQIAYETPDGQNEEAFCLRWDLSLSELPPPDGHRHVNAAP